MAKLNKPVCATQFGNTGFGDCYIDLDKIAGAIQVTKNFVITEDDIEGLQDFLKTKIHAAIGTRIFPYHNFVSVNDQTEDVNIETTDYGAKLPIRDGFYDFTFRYVKGGVLLHQEIQKNEGTGKYFLFYDANGILIGYKTSEGLKGIPVDVFKALPWRLATGAAGAQFLLRFIFDPKYINKGNLGYLVVEDFNLFDIEGLQDVAITLVELNANVATVQLRSKISDVNMYDAYSTNLAQTTAYSAEDEDGDTVAITNVSANASAEGFDITFSSTQFNNADKVYLKGSSAATWKAAPISVEGFEAKDALEIEAPAS